jgi:hypothetical protein
MIFNTSIILMTDPSGRAASGVSLWPLVLGIAGSNPTGGIVVSLV